MRKPPLALLGSTLALLGVLAAQDAPRGGEGPRRGNRPVRTKPVVLKVGTLHPISGPAIADGVVVITNGTISAVGSAAEVKIPPEAEVLEYPTAHAYPGLVDAWTSLYLDAGSQADAAQDAGTEPRTAFDVNDPAAPGLVAAGITTAYVSTRSPSTWRGQGALVRPREGRVLPFRAGGMPPQDAAAAQGAAVEVRLQAGAVHPLERHKALSGVGEPFDQLESYEKAFTDHTKALEEYTKKFDEYLGWHRARNPEAARAESRPSSAGASRPAAASTPSSLPAQRPSPEGAESRPAGDGGPGQGRGGRGRRGGFPGGGGPGGGPQPQATPGPTSQATPAANGSPATPPPAAQGGEAPQRPTYPKAPARDPAKDALLKVKKGELPLRIEAQREDEVRAALKLQREKQVKRVVLAGAAEAAPLAKEIAEQGVPVVLTGLGTGPASELRDEEDVKPEHRIPLAKALADAGVTLAIASGSAKAARNLPLLAANAVGQGLSEATALRAITLSAAEVLGIARSCGSLERGKLGDVLVTSTPLLRSDSRVLRVLSAGETVYESK